MEVKVYRMPEVEELILDEEKQKRHDELMAKMGLTAPKEDSKKINPFTVLNDYQFNAIKCVCPVMDKAEEYNKSTIPLEVLEVIDYCKDANMFDSYKILHTVSEPDPILLGIIQGENSWNKTYYILARWGAEAMPLDQLVEKGVEIAKKNVKSQVLRGIDELETLKRRCDDYVEMALSGSKSLPSIYINLK